MKQTRVALIGLGMSGKAFLQLMVEKEALLAERYGLALVLTAAADSSGGVSDPNGIDPAALLAHKQSGQGAAAYAGGEKGLPAARCGGAAEADLLLEASPVNLQTGGAGPELRAHRDHQRDGRRPGEQGAAGSGVRRTDGRGGASGDRLPYSATVCGALPVVNVGRRDLVGCDIRGLRGIFNSTSNSILEAMGRGGTYGKALKQAQLDGIAEADPTLDVEGWDTANKLVIIANSILGMPATLRDVRPAHRHHAQSRPSRSSTARARVRSSSSSRPPSATATATGCRSSQSGCPRTIFWPM